MVDDGDTVAEAFRLFDVMRGHKDCFFLAAQLFDDVVDFAAHLWVQAGGRLIQKKHAWVVYQSHGERQALLLSAGKLAVEGVALFFQAETLQQLLGIAAALVESSEKAQRFHDAQFVGQGSRLQRSADFMFQLARADLRVETANAHGAAIGIAQASRISTVVVLPAPLGPSKPKTSPSSTVKLRPRTA